MPGPQNCVIMKTATPVPVRTTAAVLPLAPANELHVGRKPSQQRHKVIPTSAMRCIPIRNIRTVVNRARAQLMAAAWRSGTTRSHVMHPITDGRERQEVRACVSVYRARQSNRSNSSPVTICAGLAVVRPSVSARSDSFAAAPITHPRHGVTAIQVEDVRTEGVGVAFGTGPLRRTRVPRPPITRAHWSRARNAATDAVRPIETTEACAPDEAFPPAHAVRSDSGHHPGLLRVRSAPTSQPAREPWPTRGQPSEP
jgi:hypothetical protein